MTDSQKKQLRNYYNGKQLAIIGLNDSQGIDTFSILFKKGLLEFLRDELKHSGDATTIINAFSLLLNKTEHIDYLLKSNLTLEQIKYSQIYSAVSAYEKVMKDLKLPKVLGQVGNIYRIPYRIHEGDENIHITTAMKESDEVITVYSSGVNNLMREIANNPFSIIKDYKNRAITPNYDYTLEHMRDPLLLAKVMDGIENNFDKLLSINNKMDIYALGSYVPKSLRRQEMQVFRELIDEYNEYLRDLCESYKISFIDTNIIGSEYSIDDENFHINKEGQKRLANKILESIYENKMEPHKSNTIDLYFPLNMEDESFFYKSLYADYKTSLETLDLLDGYPKTVHEGIVDERYREMGVLYKAIQKTKK